ncbi:hypothetical protein KY290_006657 [Solanum tuberosum]|uniref:Peptidase A1 domain-containing protein n=1 Tax=Solanum tuberosum TaxID=4113 RepID=A0ABQ7WI35_SOLTU|nr:hypothetical protein KY290_006657 [Solanum tuberosum]
MENCMIWMLFLLASYSQFSDSSVVVSARLRFIRCIAGVLQLERLLPENHVTTIDALVARDRARHARILRTVTSGLVNFPLNSSFDFNNIGIYFTKVKVGSPPREYNLLIDTGSEVSWIACSSCNTCPRTNGLGVKLNFYDSGNSTTAISISCSTRGCKCTRTNQCGFTLSYMDESSTTGYFVSDVWHLDTILSTSSTASSPARIIFGCSTSELGSLVLTDNAIDGIIGFDRHSLSIISQLSSRGISPKVFSHCLKGESGINGGGGILVLGEILNPSMVYTPLVPSTYHYNVDLQSIAVNGKLLPIDPAVFETSEDEDRGTIFDSGTSLIHLVAEAYDSVISAITAAISSSAKPITSGTNPCYLISSSSSNNVTKLFPQVTLHFAGSVSMDLKPADYLTNMSFFNDTAQWCVFLIRKSLSLTILGDIALRDKSIVYDLAHQRIGWADHDCSLPVNVSISSGVDQVMNVRVVLFHILESMLCIYLFWW